MRSPTLAVWGLVLCPFQTLIRVDGKLRILYTIGELADALHRTPHTVRQWTRAGLIPEAPLTIQPGDTCTRRRLYPAELIEAIRNVTVQEDFGRRRPSGLFLYQQQRLWDAWRAVIDALIDEGDGVTNQAP
jgi:hypothetical protein